MKSIWRSFLILALSCGLSLVCIPLSHASDNVLGGNINGTETFDAQASMTATASAPSGSSIDLSLGAEDNDGAMNGRLGLNVKGLPAGTYNVSVTLRSNGSTVALGSFTVAAGSTETLVQFGDSGTPFPANFDPFDIATIMVSNASNVALFQTDLTNLPSLTSMNFNASLTATAGTTDPNAEGNAVLTAHTAKGSGAHGMLLLNGHGLIAGATLTLAVNGTNMSTVKVNRGGNVNIQLGSRGKSGKGVTGLNFFSIESITLHDSVGNVLLSVDF